MTSSFVSLHSSSTLITETNSSGLIFESIKATEIKTSMVFNLAFAHNSIILYFFHLFLILDFNFLIFAVTTQIFNPTAELAIPIGIPSNEAKAETETHSMREESKISHCSKTFVLFTKQIIFVLFLLSNNFLFHLFFLI